MDTENTEPLVEIAPQPPIGVPSPEVVTPKRRVGGPQKAPHVPKSCLHCGATFLAPPARRDVYHFCSDRCRWAFHEAKVVRTAHVETPAQLAAAVEADLLPVAPPTSATPSLLETRESLVAAAADRPLSPAVTARLRGRIAAHVSEHIDIAAAVISGKISWTPTQARVFSDLLKKVVPDLSASHVTHESTKDVSQFTREELERLAAGDASAIDVEVAPLPPGAPE